MFDNVMSEINNLSKNDIDLILSKRATLSDFCISFFNKSAGEFGSKDLYQMMGNKEKVKTLGNALAFRVGEVLELGDVEVKSLMRKIEEDKPLSLTENKKNEVKTGLKIKGFTLIELMVAVGIVGLLSAFAIPAYQAHIAKAQVSEGITLAEGFKSGVSEFYANNGIFPKLSDLGMSGALGKWVADTSIESNGVIVATFNSDVVKGLSGKTLSLTPSIESAGNLSWACSSNAPQDYLPKSCLEAVASGGNSGSGDDIHYTDVSVFGNYFMTNSYIYVNGEPQYSMIIYDLNENADGSYYLTDDNDGSIIKMNSELISKAKDAGVSLSPKA
ncbi:pilin [Burkholderia vietnamiensis]|uniref:pilin n=1 Tax=Burkholderia vietnamiensis TaxID=60552 RepID=UPI001ABA133F|nr:pilin [Burkholderia vietnamiensis]